jgi:uncharacterized protein DUF4384
MKRARSRRLFIVGAVAILAAAPAASRAAVHVDASISYEAAHSPRLDVDVWTNKEEGGVYRQGEPMRVFFRPSADSYVLIYNVDTEGYIHLVYPYGPDDPDRLEGGRTYQVPSRNDPYELVADGPTGIEYVVAIASPEPFRDLPWYLTGNYDPRDHGDEYRDDEGDNGDNGDSGVIVGDPYVGMDRVVRRVVPRGLEDEVATADTYFYIERRVEYPRYVCADCHSYGGWFDPYGDVCTVVDIRIDSGWAHYRPFRSAILRPRYFYMVRSSAPSRYRQWKDRWSSVDGRATLRTRFQVDGTDKFQSRRQMIQRRTPPEFQNLRRPRTEGRLWRPNEVLRRNGGDARDRGDAANPGDTRQRGDAGQNQDSRRRSWFDSRERRQNDPRQMQEQRRNDERRMQDQRQSDQRRMQEQRQNDQRQMQEQRREDQRDRERARSEDRRRDDSNRDQARQRDDRSNDRSEDRGSRDRGRSEDRRRDDGDRGQDRGSGRGRR